MYAYVNLLLARLSIHRSKLFKSKNHIQLNNESRVWEEMKRSCELMTVNKCIRV